MDSSAGAHAVIAAKTAAAAMDELLSLTNMMVMGSLRIGRPVDVSPRSYLSLRVEFRRLRAKAPRRNDPMSLVKHLHRTMPFTRLTMEEHAHGIQCLDRRHQDR